MTTVLCVAFGEGSSTGTAHWDNPPTPQRRRKTPPAAAAGGSTATESHIHESGHAHTDRHRHTNTHTHTGTNMEAGSQAQKHEHTLSETNIEVYAACDHRVLRPHSQIQRGDS